MMRGRGHEERKISASAVIRCLHVDRAFPFPGPHPVNSSRRSMRGSCDSTCFSRGVSPPQGTALA